MIPTAPCSFKAAIDTYFDRGLPPHDAHTLYEHLPDCASCRRRYDRHLVLESLSPGTKDSKARLRTTLDVQLAPAIVTARRWWAPVAAMVAIAACALFFLRSPRDDAEFHARGGATTTLAPRLEVYRLRGTQPSSVVDAVGNGDELAFAYANPTGKKRLLVFAVDDHRHVYWYYPAWTRPEDTPVAVPIVATRDLVELKEGITHTFDARLLRLYSVFTDDAMTTRDVEAKLAGMPPLAPRLDWPGTLEISRELEVH